METILQDARYGLRQLRRHPSFAAVAVLTLGIGIGVSTALFSVIDAALLRPLPYPAPEQLVTVLVEQTGRSGRASPYAPSVADIRAWRGVSSVIAHTGSGYVSGFMPLIVDAGTVERLTVASASEDFLETYGVRPILGRSIQLDDTHEHAPSVVLLGHAFWLSRFGGDDQVIGRPIRIQDKPVTIIGVLPPGFFAKTAVWQASQWGADFIPLRGSGTPVIARLRPGVTLDKAARALDQATPTPSDTASSPVRTRVRLTSMYEEQTSGYGSTLSTLTWAVALIVTIACVNVAGLLLARGATRQQELAVRASLGAGRRRLMRQLIIENLMLGSAGAVVGIALAYLSLDSLVGVLPLSLPLNSPAAMNLTVLGLALGVTLISSILFGLVPAVKLSGSASGVQQGLGSANRGAGTPLSRRGGQWLIGVEVALAFVLLAGSGLMVRSFSKLLAVDLGLDTSNVLTLGVEPVQQDGPVFREFYSAISNALRRFPEVQAVGAVDRLTLDGARTYWGLEADTGTSVRGPKRTVLPGFFEAMGVRPIAGRLFADSDLSAGEAVILSATGAAKYFSGAAVGQTLKSADRTKTPRLFRIVGVVPDIKHGGPVEDIEAQTYLLPDPQPSDLSVNSLAMIIRLHPGSTIQPDRLRQVAESMGPRVVVGAVRPADEVARQHVRRSRNRMVLLVLLGGLGLLLTLVGIASMTAYAVARRTREVGLRIAMGARPIDVVGGIVRDAAWPVALGLVAGLGGAYYATRVIASLLFQTPPHDVATLASVALLLGVAACIAAWVPARRATKIDPITALRAE